MTTRTVSAVCIFKYETPAHQWLQVQYANDHHWLLWLVATCVTISYAFVISVSIPFFSTLVGLIASATYLTTAYTIPALCTLAMMGKRIPTVEYYLCVLLVPLSILGSSLGMYSSVLALLEDLQTLQSSKLKPGWILQGSGLEPNNTSAAYRFSCLQKLSGSRSRIDLSTLSY